jgi:hypothetical protein
MCRRAIASLFLMLLTSVAAMAQMPPSTGAPQPLAPPTAAPESSAPESSMPPAPGTQPPLSQPTGPQSPVSPQAGEAPQAGRVFCEQNVDVELADPATVPEPYRRFLGIWSDAAWDAHTCAALIVERIKPDGAASIIYVFGPQGSGSPGPGGVLHGTGVIRGGALRFQNSDGSQFAFQPGIVDMTGHLINPRGESFAATFKQTP